MWRLPGPLALLASLAAALDDGRSVQMLVPTHGGPSYLLPQLRSQVRDQPWSEIALGELIRPGMSFEGALLHVLGVDADFAMATTADLARAPAMGRRVLAVDCGLGAHPAQVTQLGRLISAYAAATRDRPASHRAVFAVCCPGIAGDSLPGSDTFVVTRWWWGVLTRIDTEAHLRLRGLDERLTSHELAIICELAAFDLQSAELLAEAWNGDPADLCDLVPPLPESEATAIRTAVARLDGPGRDRPPAGLVHHWDQGLVESWSDRTPCTHLSCVLAAADLQPANRLIWRAQLTTLMPLIELQRERLANWAHARRAGIVDSWSLVDITELEIGPLARMIYETPRLRSSTPHLQLAKWLTQTRNALAHREMINRESLDRGQALISAI